MAKSTASFIAYDVRPEKQIERRAIVEYLGLARQSGFTISDYRYVGFGGTKFIDFQMMERYIGFSDYVSVERDHDIFNRCKFNKPFHGIRMHEGEFSDFLLVDETTRNTVFWVDLESTISPSVAELTNSLAENAKAGDVVFFTICAEPPAGTGRKSDRQRKDVIRSKFPAMKSLIASLPANNFNDKNFPTVSGILLSKMLRNSFATRRQDGIFNIHLKIIYADSANMCTIGGVFGKRKSGSAAKLGRAVRAKMSPIYKGKEREFYRIPQFNFTELERILLHKSDMTKQDGYSRRLQQLGIERGTLEEYERIARFVPKYIETAF
ncbi:O-methyltransferase [Fulvimarina sp. MAC3]|uniref:O-methyltransferase n=1 Tax=Fulvimarina sp. MAC3 TaxID=3148887 RepID=UPI0031FCBEE6